MTKLNFLGSMLIAFALGGAGMWAYDGNLKPLLHRVESRGSVQTTGQATASLAPGGVVPGNSGSITSNRGNLGSPLPLQGQLDPFQQMLHMQQQMNRIFGQDNFFNMGPGFFGAAPGQGNGVGQGSSQPGMNFFQGGTASNTSIEQGEDANSVYYKLHVGDQDLSNVKVNVTDGYVSIDAKLENKSSNSYSSSSVSERFPVPAGVDPDSAKISHEGNDLVIRFAKV